MNENLDKRFWEIDFLRGVAIIMMIIFHILFDLDFLGIKTFEVHSGFLSIFARTTAVIFLLLVGISLTLSYSRIKKKLSEKKLFKKYFKRGLIIFGYGLLITLTTWLYIKKGFVIFGILHLIGVSIILSYPFLRFRFLNLFLGILFIIIGIYLRGMLFDFNWLMWLGFIPNTLYTIDYFPLLPWFGVILIGIFLGNIFYPDYNRIFNLKNHSNFNFIKIFTVLGKNSLVIYLVHQPVLIFFLYLLGLT